MVLLYPVLLVAEPGPEVFLGQVVEDFWRVFPALDWSECGVLFDIQLKVPTTEKPTVTVNFRKLLLNRCQKEFEKDKDDDEVFEKKQKEMDEAATVRETPFPVPLLTRVRLTAEVGVGILVFWGFLCLRT